MARYTGPRARVSRRLGTNIWGTKGETVALDRQPPGWIESGDGGWSATVRELPAREQIDVPVREQLIVELYSK